MLWARVGAKLGPCRVPWLAWELHRLGGPGALVAEAKVGLVEVNGVEI